MNQKIYIIVFGKMYKLNQVTVSSVGNLSFTEKHYI